MAILHEVRLSCLNNSGQAKENRSQSVHRDLPQEYQPFFFLKLYIGTFTFTNTQTNQLSKCSENVSTFILSSYTVDVLEHSLERPVSF